MAENVNTNTSEVHEPEPSEQPKVKERRSSIDKIKDVVMKPFHHKEKETPPALQEAIDKMKDRKSKMEEDMEQKGVDTTPLSGKRRDIVGIPGTSK